MAKPTNPATAPSAGDMLHVEDVAALLQISPSSIRQYLRDGVIEAYRIGGMRRLLIPRAEVMKLLVPIEPSALADADLGEEGSEADESEETAEEGA